MPSGNGGQKVFLVPSLDLIVVFTGGAFNLESPVNEMMARVLLPVLSDMSAKRPLTERTRQSQPAASMALAGRTMDAVDRVRPDASSSHRQLRHSCHRLDSVSGYSLNLYRHEWR
jgi:hypothetical protein